MAKVRLLIWIATLAVATVLLLETVSRPPLSDPARSTMAAVQLVAGLLAAYLLLATLLAIRLPRLAPAFVRRLVATAVGGTMVLSPALAGAAPAADRHAADAPVLHRLTDDSETTTTTVTTGSGRVSAPDDRAFPPSSPDEVVVAPGDHLWGIAERTLTARLGREPTEDETARYWTRLIEANRDRLASGDPDLIFAGQVFRLPS